MENIVAAMPKSCLAQARFRQILKEEIKTKISKVAELMKNIVGNEDKIGEVKRKLKKKEQNPQQVLNSQDQKLDNKDEILKVYARYKELFKIRSVENMEEEEMDGKNLQEGNNNRTKRRPGYNNNSRNKESNQENEKKAGAKNNWKAEQIKEGGD